MVKKSDTGNIKLEERKGRRETKKKKDEKRMKKFERTVVETKI